MKTQNKEITIEKSNGRIYTSDFIVENILDLSGYYGDKILKKHVIDNSCGDGAFLRKIVQRYCEESARLLIDKNIVKEELGNYIHGIEIERVERDKCINNIEEVANSYGIYGVNWDIICGDALKEHKFDGKMDYVLGNPPYIRVHNLGENVEDIKKFSFAQSGMTDLFIVFYEIGLKMLKSTGTLGYITPSSFFNSVAGAYMRKVFVEDNLISSIVNLRHFQAFMATTYTTIVVLKKNKEKKELDYYQYDEKNLIPYYVDTLAPDDFYISSNYYFSKKGDLKTLKRILFNLGKSDIAVKNGYATLCDSVFINDFSFQSKHIISVIKASTGELKEIIYPYNKQAQLVPEEELAKEKELYEYLILNKKALLKRSNEKDTNKYWYAFGRSQAINDTYTDKLTINALLRTKEDWKFTLAKKGVGVYGGLYIISDTISYDKIKETLRSDEFVSYITLLGKYKSGGYYTFSSKDVKAYLDFKFANNGGIFDYD